MAPANPEDIEQPRGPGIRRQAGAFAELVLRATPAGAARRKIGECFAHVAGKPQFKDQRPAR
jgi:hypothetical protein